jgi:hypothetical protein
MTTIQNIFRDITDQQLTSPVEFAKFFLEKIKQRPGK